MNKKNLHVLFLSAILNLAVNAQNRSITFSHATFKELKEQALTTNRLIFIDAYTTWCGPCKYMAKNVFTNDTVADYYNAHFINAKIDMEKGEGIELAKQYNVNCYPTLLYIDGNGNIKHRESGALDTKDFIDLGKRAQLPEGTYSYYVKNYESQKNNTDFLVKFIHAQSNTCIEPTELVTHYFSLQKEEDLSNAQNWEMILNYTADMNSREFVYLINNKKKFDLLYTEKAVNQKIEDVYLNSLVHIIKTTPFDEAQYKKTKDKILSENLEGNRRVVFESDIVLAKKYNDIAQYVKLAMENVDTYYKNNSRYLNSVAWDFYEQVSDKSALLKAEEWAKTSTELDPNYANMDTYASLLYKNGKKQLALETANKAIELAKKDGMGADDYKSTSDLLNQIKAMK